MRSSKTRKWPRRIVAASAVMALAWWWMTPPAAAWHSSVSVTVDCAGWQVAPGDTYSPETASWSYTPAQAGTWDSGSVINGSATVSWSDYDDTQSHDWTAAQPADCDPPKPPVEPPAPPVDPPEVPEAPEEPPVLIPPVQEWQSPPPPDDPPPPATPAVPRQGQPQVTG